MADLGKVSRALISVTDKTGVVEFAKALADEFGVEVISTGGTAKVLVEAGVPVVPIEEYTGFPEMMDGRVKTLHPKVHGGLLARRDSEQHMAEAAEHGIGMIDMVVVNLYEFEKTVAKPDVTFIDAIEHIDIGGPSMLRSAAKNADAVTVVSDPADYEAVLAEMRANDGATTLGLRRALQAKVYATTAAYDTAISDWMMAQLEGGAVAVPSAAEQFEPPAAFSLKLEKVQDLRYGENPHQTAAMYLSLIHISEPTRRPPCTASPTTSPASPPPPPRSWAPISCRASRCRTTTSSTPRPPGTPCATLRSRASSSSSTRTPAAPPLPPT